MERELKGERVKKGNWWFVGVSRFLRTKIIDLQKGKNWLIIL